MADSPPPTKPKYRLSPSSSESSESSDDSEDDNDFVPSQKEERAAAAELADGPSLLCYQGPLGRPVENESERVDIVYPTAHRQ